jgi:cathepsin L
MLTLFLPAALLSVASAISLNQEPSVDETFQEYASRFGKDYVKDSAEYTHRLAWFQHRVKRIEAHNSKVERRWTAGVNWLTDRTDEELSQLRGWKQRGPSSSPKPSAFSVLGASNETEQLDESVDWRNLSMTGVLLDQGGCGSCWAVATAVMLQGRYEAKTGKTRTFSPQQLVNCVPNPRECGGQGGCAGATVELAMEYIQNNPSGLDDLTEEKYTAMDGECKLNQKYKKPPLSADSFLSTRGHDNNKAYEEFGLTAWSTLTKNKARPLMRAVMDGPVAISLDASGWDSYSSGIYDSCSKDATVNHAVVLFGYGADSDMTKYWLIKNSWGESWGQSGYIRLLRHSTPDEDDAYCGTDYNPSVGIACKPYPKTEHVCGMCGVLFDSVAVDFKAK